MAAAPVLDAAQAMAGAQLARDRARRGPLAQLAPQRRRCLNLLRNIFGDGRPRPRGVRFELWSDGWRRRGLLPEGVPALTKAHDADGLHRAGLRHHLLRGHFGFANVSAGDQGEGHRSGHRNSYGRTHWPNEINFLGRPPAAIYIMITTPSSAGYVRQPR